MFGVGLVYISTYLLLQSIAGKSIDLEYGYQEIEDKQPEFIEESSHLEIDRLSDKALENLCKYLKIGIRIKDTDAHVNCLQPDDDDTKKIILVKRDASENDNEVEGSGEPDDQKVVTTEDQLNITTASLPTTILSTESHTSSQNLTNEQSSSVQATDPTTNSIVEETDEPTMPENPVMFKNGFDDFLNNLPPQNKSIKDITHPTEIIEGEQEETVVLAAPNPANSPVATGEVAKTGESQEKPSAASPNKVLLIVFAVLGIVGVAAFAFNYIKNKRENKEIDEAMKVENEGRELKEMKPLMKNPLTQNGSKSLEYIDAEPQNGSEVRVEVNQNNELV